MRWPEIGPIAWQEHEFRICGLPEKKIGKPLFAACADYQVRIRNVGRIESRVIASGVIFSGAIVPDVTSAIKRCTARVISSREP